MPVASMATVPTPASIKNAVKSARPAWVVLKRSLATSTSPPGSVTLVQATTPSRWTSRPPTLFLICFMCTSHCCRRPPGEDHGVKRNLRFVLTATLGGPHGPAPDLSRALGCKKTSATTPDGRPPSFHPLMVTGQVMTTYREGRRGIVKEPEGITAPLPGRSSESP